MKVVSAVHYSTVQYSTVQYRTVHNSSSHTPRSADFNSLRALQALGTESYYLLARHRSAGKTIVLAAVSAQP